MTRPGTRRNKCGILPFIANFERFVATTEAIFKSSERRVDLEKWYLILVTAMVTAIARIAFQVSIAQVWPLNHFFLFPLCKKSLISREGKSMSPLLEETFL